MVGLAATVVVDTEGVIVVEMLVNASIDAPTDPTVDITTGTLVDTLTDSFPRPLTVGTDTFK